MPPDADPVDPTRHRNCRAASSGRIETSVSCLFPTLLGTTKPIARIRCGLELAEVGGDVIDELSNLEAAMPTVTAEMEFMGRKGR